MDAGQGTLPAGFQFGAYVIGSCIGQGGMARIYRAEHRVLRKPVALKVMESALLERPDGRPRFLREGQAAAAVKHPNVVDITDVGVWQGRPYLVMELLEGEDLEQYLSRHRPLAESDVARIMIPVIAGLATAHAAGVIHRDLKPSNVFLARGPDGEIVPKLLDFGISKLANALRSIDATSTPLGELMGSPMYMSPEAVRGARDLSPQSDQYSLGVMLYECVTGRPPFYGDSLLSVLEAVAHGHFEPPRRYRPDLSTALEVAILRAMSRDASARYPTVRDLGRALCETADQRTRLLWTPSFGVREVSPSRHTVNLGSSSFGAGSPRTGSPLSSSVRWRSWRFGSRRVGLSAFALIAVAVAGVTYWRLPPTPHVEALPSSPGDARAKASGVAAAAAARASALPTPHAAATPPAAHPAPRLSASATRAAAAGEPRSDARERVADSAAEAARRHRPPPGPAKGHAPRARVPGKPAPSRPPAPQRPAADETLPAGLARAAAAASQPANGLRAPAALEEPAAGSLGDADEVVFPVRAPAPSRPAPVLGANQSPILD